MKLKIGLESMNLELILFDQIGIGQEHADFIPLIPLELDDLPVLGMFHDSPVAGELLLANPHNLLEVVLVRESLHGGQGLPSIPLLDPDVDDGVLDALTSPLLASRKGSKALRFSILDIVDFLGGVIA